MPYPVAFGKKSCEDVDLWIRSMGIDFAPFADELSGWGYEGEDILELTEEDFFNGFANVSTKDARNHLWYKICLQKQEYGLPVKGNILKTEEILQLKKHLQITLEGPTTQGLKSGNYTHVAYECDAIAFQISDLRESFDGGVAILDNHENGAFKILGHPKLLEYEVSQAQKIFNCNIVEAGRYIANAFEIQLNCEHLYALSEMYETFQEIECSWSVLMKNGSPDLNELGEFCLRVYGKEPITALGVLSAKVGPKVWENVSHYLLVKQNKINLKSDLTKIVKKYSAKVSYFTSHDETLNALIFGKLLNVADVVKSLEKINI